MHKTGRLESPLREAQAAVRGACVTISRVSPTPRQPAHLLEAGRSPALVDQWNGYGIRARTATMSAVLAVSPETEKKAIRSFPMALKPW